MDNQQILQLAVSVLLVAGALNWGAIAYLERDLVRELAGEHENKVKLLVGVAGIVAAFKLYEDLVKLNKQ